MGEGRTWSDKDLVDARALGQLPRESVFPSSCTDQENPELLQGGGGGSNGVKSGSIKDEERWERGRRTSGSNKGLEELMVCPLGLAKTGEPMDSSSC